MGVSGVEARTLAVKAGDHQGAKTNLDSLLSPLGSHWKVLTGWGVAASDLSSGKITLAAGRVEWIGGVGAGRSGGREPQRRTRCWALPWQFSVF